MGHNDPALTDAFRLTAQGIAAARSRDEFVRSREADLEAALRRPLLARVQPHWALSHNDVTIGREFAAWLLERQDDIEVADAIFSDGARARIVWQFICERAEADADAAECRGVDWYAEAADALAWERGGRP